MGEPASPRARTFWSQSAVLIAASGASAVLAAVYSSQNGRLLGPSEFSQLAASLSLSSLLALLLGPLETGVSKFAADAHAAGDRGRLATLAFVTLRRLLLPLLGGVVLWVALVPLVGRGLRFDSLGELAVMIVYSAFTFMAGVTRGVQRGDHRFFAYGLNQVVEAAVRLGAGIALILCGLGAAGALGGYAAGMAVALLLSLWQLRDLRAAPRAPVGVARVYDFSLPLLFVYLYFQMAGSADVLAAKRHLPADEAGIYGAASMVARMLFLVATPIYQVLFSRVAVLRARGQAAAPLATPVLALVAAGLLVSYAAPWFFAEQLLTLLVGPKFAGGAPILRVQWITTSLLVLQAVVTFVLLGDDRTRGAWAFLLPCALLVGLLWRFHATGVQVALDTLVAVAAATPVLAVMLVASARRRSR